MYKTHTDTPSPLSVGVIGAGAWGTALATVIGRAGRQVALWGRTHSDLIDIAKTGFNRRYLPDIPLNPLPHVTREIAHVMNNGMIFLAVPAQEIRNIAPLIAPYAHPQQPFILCAKGVERGTNRLMSEVLREFFPYSPIAVLSGPTFATEVAKGLPAAVTIAADEIALATHIASNISSPTFRCYASSDLKGVELCGAIKNVLAIASGIVAGRGLGDNARAALITRGLAEVRRLCLSMGAQAETPMGLAGLGDLILTCTSSQSRNYSFGHAIGKGEKPDSSKLAEGYFSLSSILQRADEAGVDMPICAAVDAIINRGIAVDDTMNALLSRPLKLEID